MSDPDRRTRIAEAALDIVAEQGARALTHRAVDRRLGLPTGSTSFYLRTRLALLEAAVTRLAARARQDFDESGARVPDPREHLPGLHAVARTMAVLLDRMVGPRRRDTVARYALAIEVAGDEHLRSLLARAAFSHDLAVDLVTALGAPEPRTTATGLISLTEGLVFDRVVGNGSLDAPAPGSAASIDALAGPVETYLRGALRA